MTDHKYAFQVTEHMAKAVGRDLPISYKTATEVCRFLRGKTVTRAITDLEAVKRKQLPVPYLRYNTNIPHKAHGAAGRYPIKCASEILALLNSVTANAQSKGLATGKLKIIHVCTHKAASQAHRGRRRGRNMKRAHVEIVVDESAVTKKAKQTKKQKSTHSKDEKKKEDQK